MAMVSQEFINALRDASLVAPELPEADAYDTLAALTDYEAQIILPKDSSRRQLLDQDYADGSANTPGDVLVIEGSRFNPLLCAEHATAPIRAGKHHGADQGTGGLAVLLAQRTESTAIIPTGKQLGYTSLGDEHPVKQSIATHIDGRPGFFSIHGMRPGKFIDPSDTVELHALIGLGAEPDDVSRSVSDMLIAKGQELGLRVAVSDNEHRHYEYDETSDGYVTDSKTGSPLYAMLAGSSPRSTTNYARKVMEQTSNFRPAFQLEMTRMLRLLPADVERGWHKDKKALAIGVHLGYLLCSSALQIVENAQSD